MQNASSVNDEELGSGDQISGAVAESYVNIPSLDSLDNGVLSENYNAVAHNAAGIDDYEINKAFTRKKACVIAPSAAIDSDESIDEESRCAVCYLQMVLPVQLPCNHIFCFLCVKGVALTNSPRCALCRQPIPADFLLRPTLVQLPGTRKLEAAAASSSHSLGGRSTEVGSIIKGPEGDSSDGLRSTEPFNSKKDEILDSSPLKAPPPSTVGASSNRSTGVEDLLEDAAAAAAISAEEELLDYHWFYEGRNGWWSYDQRTSEEIESFYQKRDSTCQVMVAGLVFVVDFSRMLQYRSKDPTKRRKIKRDVSSIPIKGVAGISLRRLDGGEEEAGEELPSDMSPPTLRQTPHTEIGRVDQEASTRPRRFLTRDSDHNYAGGDRQHLSRDVDHAYADGERRLLTRDIDHNYADGGRRYALRDTDHNYAEGEGTQFSRDTDHNYADGDRRCLLRDADHNYAHSDTLHNTSLESVRDTSVRSRLTASLNVQDRHRNQSINCCISHPYSANEHLALSDPASASPRSIDTRSLHQSCREGVNHRRGHPSRERVPEDLSRPSDESGRFDHTSDVAGPSPSISHCADCGRPRCMALPPTSSVHQSGQMFTGNFELPPCLHIHACHNCHPTSSHYLCCHHLGSGWCSISSNASINSDDDGVAESSLLPTELNYDATCQGEAVALPDTSALGKSSLNCSCNSRRAATGDHCQCPLSLPSNTSYRPGVLYDEPPEYYHIDLDFGEEDNIDGDPIHNGALASNPTRSSSHQPCKPADCDDACSVELTCYNDLQSSGVKEGEAATAVSVLELPRVASGAADEEGSQCDSGGQAVSDYVAVLSVSDNAEIADDAYGPITQ